MSVPISKADWQRQRRAATEALPDLVRDIGLPKILLPYQARVVKLLFVEKSRRIGLTWGLAAYGGFASRSR